MKNELIPTEESLTSKRVSEIFHSCLFEDEEDMTNYVEAEGIRCSVGFHPGRIEQYKDEIFCMLKQLPDSFMASSGGGMSFLNACNDREGRHWGEHQTMDMLFQLGTAIKRATLCMPREMWSVLPGGMPYYVVDDSE